MHSHLVTIEVGVEGRTNEWVQLNGFTFDQNWLKGLDAETVQRWRTVQHDRVFANDFFEDIPDDWLFVFNHLLGLLDGGRQTHTLKAIEDERFEQFQRHQLGQTTLM